MKQAKQIILGLVIISSVALPFAFNACSPAFFTADISTVEKFEVEDPVITSAELSPNVSPFNDSLLTGDQLIRSMASLTKVTVSAANSPAAIAEFSKRFGSFAADYSPRSINAPSIISTSSVAGEFCEKALVAESATGAARYLFPAGVSLATTGQLSAQEVLTAANNMASKFWDRSLKSDEQAILTQFVSEMGAVNPRKMMQVTCAVMLSSFDSISL